MCRWCWPEQALNEVVVVGYGTQRKADVTGATSTVSSRDFNTGVINNPLQAVQGKVAGLVITSPNGDPTQNRPTIRLRGGSSLNANAEPLIVIDGVLGAPLNSVAPEDIEKYDVLKDASASAIYGVRGANGVIIITTKRGKAGRTIAEYNGYIGIGQAAALPTFLTPEAFRTQLKTRLDSTAASPYNTNGFKQLTRTAVSHNHNVGISGGTSQFNYRASVTYLNQPGIAVNSGLDRLNARLGVTQTALQDRLEIQINVAASQVNKSFVSYQAFQAASRFSPLDPVFNPDGTYFQRQGGIEQENPLARAAQLTNEAREKLLLGNVKLSLEVVKGLKLGVNAAINSFNSLGGSFTPRAFKGLGNTRSQGNRSTQEVSDRLIEYTAAYNAARGKHTVGALVGYTYQYITNEGYGVTAYDYPDQFSFNQLQAANNPVANSDLYSYKTEARLDGLLARVNYGYADRYLLTVNFRRDGSSRFGANNRYGYFPSASVGWRLTEESFLKGMSWLNELKLRAGYGVTGNQNGIADNASLLLYGPAGKYYDPSSGLYKTSYSFVQNANPNLQWESSAMANLGLDFGLLNNRLSGSLEFYTKDTRNVLYNYPIAIGSRYGEQALTAVTNSLLANVGQINNKGIELTLDYLAVDRQAFQWRTMLNLAHNRNRVVRLASDGFSFPKDGIRYGVINNNTGGFGNYAVLQEGLPVGNFYGPEYAGLNDKGEQLYAAANGTTVSDAGKAELRPLGSPLPVLTLGWTNSLTWGKFDATVFFRGSFGGKVFNASRMISGNVRAFPGSNVLSSAFEGENAQITNVSPTFSSRYIESGYFLRLDNVNIGYRLPLSQNWVRSLRVYVAGQNLLLLTSYSGLDPEVRNGAVRGAYDSNFDVQQNLAFGLDDTVFYPRTRTITAGVSASF